MHEWASRKSHGNPRAMGRWDRGWIANLIRQPHGISHPFGIVWEARHPMSINQKLSPSQTMILVIKVSIGVLHCPYTINCVNLILEILVKSIDVSFEDIQSSNSLSHCNYRIIKNKK